MSELALPIEFILIGAALMLTLIGLSIALLMPGSDRTSRRFFIIYFLTIMLYCAISMISGFIYLRPGMETVQYFTDYVETLVACIPLLLMTLFLLYSCGEDWRHSALFRAMMALWLIFFIMVDISPFTDLFYYYSPERELMRGPLYSLVILNIEVMLLLNLIGTVRRRSRLSKRYYYAFLTATIPMTIVVGVHFFVSVFILLGFSIAFSSLSMFGLILLDKVEQYVRQQEEIAHQRASIMVLQMRPHFIYNTMMSIYYLCKQDADLAQQVTLDFTTYLRKNFTAIASEEPIPFAEELAHTRAYLSVEQAQFEDFLFVDYDTPHVDFRVPPLTLQPIVENAVKHGMDPDAASFHISIRTMKTEDMSVIVVENDGADFDALGTGAADDSEPHIALKNIRQRLEMMCRGKMTISPREGGGPIVKVEIP